MTLVSIGVALPQPKQPQHDTKPSASTQQGRAAIAQINRAIRMLGPTLPQPLLAAELENFAMYSNPEDAANQAKVLQQLAPIKRNIARFVADRGQLFFWGPVGTGKDHLMISLGKAAARVGVMCRFVDGEGWYNRYLIGDRREAAFAAAMEPQVLLLSDPVFHVQWTEGRQQALRTLVNTRWNKGKQTWVTCNVAALNQDIEGSAVALFGADTFSRLSDRTQFVRANWEDYREKRNAPNGQA